MIHKLLKNNTIQALYLDFKNIIQKSFPSYVWQRDPKETGKGLPVFCLHTVEPEDFESKLLFLKENGYRTLTAEEAYQLLYIEKKLPRKSVGLTFDDARKSTWCVAFPLLKKYGFKATVFMAPGLISEESQLTPMLEDVWRDRAEMSSIRNKDQGSVPLISWREAQIMHESGVIDFQSHSLNHRKISTGPKIVDFVSPELINRFYFDFGIPLLNGIEVDSQSFEKYLGAPVYESAPFFHSEKRIQGDADLRTVCLNHVAANGGEDFFRNHRWRITLLRIVRTYLDTHPFKINRETDEEQANRMVENLLKSRQMIEKRLNGKSVNHIAYPWGGACELAIHCSQKAGFVSNFWSTVPGKSENRLGDDPFHMVRMKHDFIWRLPGTGRKSLMDLFLFKFVRRFQGKLDY
jgi:hypothetical protein